jgi:hypothetical protein
LTLLPSAVIGGSDAIPYPWLLDWRYRCPTI